MMTSTADVLVKDMRKGAVAYAAKRGGFALIPTSIQFATALAHQITAVENPLTRSLDAPANNRALG